MCINCCSACIDSLKLTVPQLAIDARSPLAQPQAMQILGLEWS